MAEPERLFRYVAMNAAGRRVTGEVRARTDGLAFERLKRDGFAPVQITPAEAGRPGLGRPKLVSRAGVSDREAAELLSDLAALLEAGADIRAALSILSSRAGRPAVAETCKALSAEISGGGALDAAFARHLASRHAFISALIAAGEASGDLAGGMRRAGEILEAQIRLRDQLVSALSYPAFVFVSTLLAAGVILFFLVPSLAPLVGTDNGPAPLSLKILIGLSDALRNNAPVIAGAGLAALVGTLAALRAGLLTEPLDRLVLDGPAKRTAGGITYGAFAIALGTMLSAGAPMAEALKLSLRSVRSGLARKRLEPAAQAVRQGVLLSAALERAPGFPGAITRLSAVGEASGALGAMLVRAGRLEEAAALRRIEQAGRLLGPLLIVLLGGLVGSLMAGLLSGVSQLGDFAEG